MSKMTFVVPACIVILLLLSLGWNVQAADPAAAPPHTLVSGSLLAFQSKRDGNWEVYSANDDGTNQTRLTAKGSIDNYPRFNRGCTAIAFTSSRDVNNLNIWKMNPDGSSLTQLTTHQSDEYNPAWSPDGTRIAFVSERNGLPDIYVMGADGSAQTRLTLDPAQDVDPAWSPDGNWLAFASDRAGGLRIWKMDPAGGNLTLLSSQTNSRNPAWSPDGTRIAYDADADGDGRKELWVMNADGSGQQLLYDPGTANEDVWARSWSPDGRYIAFTHIWGYQDPQTWTAAILQAWDTYNPGTIVTLIDSGLDWHPDWQTQDTWAPTSNVLPLASVSPATFTVSWSGYDNGPAGLRDYDVQVQDNGGPWVDWLVGTTATAMPYTGVGGHTYAFRGRARDNAYNVEPYPDAPEAVTTVESAAPGTAVAPLPEYHRGTQVWVGWGGMDPGGSGIAVYDVQSNDLTAGTGWLDWRTGTPDTGATFSGISGHRYAFRSRGTDYAQNVEPWPTGPDAAVTLYTWAISGTVRDNRDTLVAGAVVTTTPGAFAMHPSDDEGAYSAYVADPASAYYASWGRAGYGSLPETDFAAAQDIWFDAVLPPADNVVGNWGFETGALAPEWTAGGTVAPGVTDTVRDSGEYGALLGCQKATFVSPSNISNMAGTSYEPQVAVDGSGNVHVVWQQGNGSGALYYARRDTAGLWSTPYEIISMPSNEAGLQAALDGSGVLHVVWVQDEGGGKGDIYYIRRTVGGTWTGLQNVSANAGNSRNPRVVVGNTGIVYAVWTDTTPGSVQILYADTTSGSWSSPLQISSMLTGGDPPQLAVDGTGNIHVLWTDRCGDPAELDVYYRWRRNDGYWDSVKNLSNSTTRSEMPQMAVEAGGVVHAVWVESADGQSTITYARRPAAGSWGAPQAITSSPYALAQPRAVLDSTGVLHVVWSGSDADTAHLFYARRATGGTWSPAEHIFQQTGTLDSLGMAVSANRTLHLIWSHDPPGALTYPEIHHLRRDSDGHWSTPYNASRTAGASQSPQMALEGNKTMHLLWTDNTPGAPAVYHAYAAFNAAAGDSTISQAIAIPGSLNAPTLSFLYLLDGASPTSGSWLSAQLGTDLGMISLFSTTASVNDWTHRWFDLSPWAGQTVTINLKVHQAAGMLCTWGYLDEVTVGSSYADLWVAKSGPSTAVPGGTVVYRLAYGNRGGVEAAGVVITDTLPAGLSFVGASPAPVSPAPPLRWEVGSLPARSAPYTIVLTATVDMGTPWLSQLINPATISAAALEMETGNNTDAATTLVGYRAYLPLVDMEKQ